MVLTFHSNISIPFLPSQSLVLPSTLTSHLFSSLILFCRDRLTSEGGFESVEKTVIYCEIVNVDPPWDFAYYHIVDWVSKDCSLSFNTSMSICLSFCASLAKIQKESLLYCHWRWLAGQAYSQPSEQVSRLRISLKTT